jgi:hypothetical protein
MFDCPHCGNRCIGWFAKFTTGIWGPVECRICGGLSRESRLQRTAVSLVELGVLIGVFLLPNGLLAAVGVLLWVAGFVAAEWYFLKRIPLVAVSKTWERSKDILSWAVVIGIVGFFVVLSVVFG